MSLIDEALETYIKQEVNKRLESLLYVLINNLQDVYEAFILGNNSYVKEKLPRIITNLQGITRKEERK